jgi:hypothetical protein
MRLQATFKSLPGKFPAYVDIDELTVVYNARDYVTSRVFLDKIKIQLGIQDAHYTLALIHDEPDELTLKDR